MKPAPIAPAGSAASRPEKRTCGGVEVLGVSDVQVTNTFFAALATIEAFQSNEVLPAKKSPLWITVFVVVLNS